MSIDADTNYAWQDWEWEQVDTDSHPTDLSPESELTQKIISLANILYEQSYPKDSKVDVTTMFNKPNDSPERVENFVCLIVFPVPRDMDKWELVISRGVQQPCRDLKILQQLWDEMRIMGGAEVELSRGHGLVHVKDEVKMGF